MKIFLRKICRFYFIPSLSSLIPPATAGVDVRLPVTCMRRYCDYDRQAGDQNPHLSLDVFVLFIYILGMLFHIYCDESRQSKDRYMILGGVLLPASNVTNFNNTMAKFRQETKMFAELKWTKVTNQKLEQYKRFVDYFFALNNTNKIRFHCIIIDNNQVDYKKYSKGDKELARYIAKQAGLRNLSLDSSRANTRFSIWNFKLSK